MAKFEKQLFNQKCFFFFCMTLLHAHAQYIYIVNEKYQKALVQFGFPVYPQTKSLKQTGKIRPVAGQGSSPETRFSFLKHFRILYPFIPNTIQINQRLCNNWHCKDLTQKNSKSMTLTLMSCTEIGLVQHKILDKALSSRHNWIKSIEGFAKNWNCKTFI